MTTASPERWPRSGSTASRRSTGTASSPCDDVSLDDPRRRVHGARRPVRLRQVDAAADDRRPRGGDRRQRSGSAARDVTELAPRHRDIAMVFQSYALYPHMTVRQNLGYGLKVRKAPKAEIAAARRRGRRPARADRDARPEAASALGRAAPAGRHGPGDRARAAGVPDGRAALEPRRQAAGRACGPRWRSSTRGSASRRSTSRTIRPRR